MPAVKLTTEQKINSQQMELARKCKRLMREADISQEVLARATGLTQATVSRQLNGAVSLPLFMAIVTLADVTKEELTKMVKVGGLR